jgi:hypothetical protein
LGHPKYIDWLKAPASSLLWISADPGCGKSVLTSFLIKTHKSYDIKTVHRNNICYFFFKDDSSEQRDSLHALHALLHQIYSIQPSLLRHVKIQQEKQDHVDMMARFATLWEIFIDTVEDKEMHNITCFIDGLDECEEVSRVQLMAAISDYFAPGQAHLTSKPLLKVIITSRPDNSIKSAFSKLATIRLRAEDEIDAISKDVALVIKANIEDLANEGIPQNLLSELQEKLIRRADRTFLWTTLVIRLLRENAQAGASRRELDAILESRDIDAIYIRLLEGRKSPGQALRMLSIVLAASRPLTLEEMNIALAVKPEHNTFTPMLHLRRPGSGTLTDFELDMIHPFENYIKTLCGHFLRIIHGKVYLVHQTAREFLLEQQDQKIQAFPQSSSLMFPPSSTTLSNQAETKTESLSQKPKLTSTTLPQPQGHRNSTETFDGNDNSTEATSVHKAMRWQNSISLWNAHGILLEICVTYLYACSREPGISSQSCLDGSWKRRCHNTPILKLFNYAATQWTHHFRTVSGGIPKNAFSYYQGLCHPLFPANHLWLFENGLKAPGQRKWHAFGISNEEAQDQMVAYFGLEPEEDETERDFDTSWESKSYDHSSYGNESDEDTSAIFKTSHRFEYFQSLRQAALAAAFSEPSSRLSSNIGSRHAFPVRPDEYGFVSLELGKAIEPSTRAGSLHQDNIQYLDRVNEASSKYGLAACQLQIPSHLDPVESSGLPLSADQVQSTLRTRSSIDHSQ